MFKQNLIRLSTITLLIGLLIPQAKSDEQAALWAVLKSGEHLALMRHAIAPGTGDPDSFELNDCSTQRNLSQAGRDQAKQIGEKLKANGIESARIYSSQWCRCLETAKLLGLGPVQELPTLNSFFRDYQNRSVQTIETKNWILKQDLSVPTILVTHQVNITALTNVFPSSGEIILVRRTLNSNLEIIGSIETN
tara:strand:+ start:475 stop:1053 length:579 start_codon:yes stop_codon:yes gene_type:complete